MSSLSGEGRRWAVVDLSVNFMREAPDYTAENGDQTLMGTVVEVVEEEGYWRQIVSPDSNAFHVFRSDDDVHCLSAFEALVHALEGVAFQQGMSVTW